MQLPVAWQCGHCRGTPISSNPQLAKAPFEIAHASHAPRFIALSQAVARYTADAMGNAKIAFIVAIAHAMGVRQESSFSEEKEAKRLFPQARPTKINSSSQASA